MTLQSGHQVKGGWIRNLSVSIFFVCLIVVCLYGWNLSVPESQSIPIGINSLGVVSASLIGIASLIFSIVWQKKGPMRNNSMAELASRLSITKGKSDVVINTITDGVLSITREGVIDLINPAAQELIGWNQGDALGLDWRSVLKLVNAEGREIVELENPIAQALSQGTRTNSDAFYLLTSSDRKRMVSIVSSPIDTTDSGTIVVLRDITKEKAEEREMAEFISTASHEMRTPVASIEGYLGLALNPATAAIDEKAREFITKAHESAQHLGRLFQDLLDISKAEDGRLKNEPRIIDVTAAVGNAFEGLSHLAAQKQLHYIFKPNPSLETDGAERNLQPVFYADIDPDHFREVTSNLIENAIKYTPQGDIVVDVKGDDSVVTVSVADSGIGIPAEDIPHLFQKFYRVDNSDTREIGGTGLGLYLCRRLAEAMGGHLRVESEYKKGSVFYFDIPRTSHEEAMRKLQEMPESAPEIIISQQSVLTAPTPEAPNSGGVAQPQYTLAQPSAPIATPAVPTPQQVPYRPTMPAQAAPVPTAAPLQAEQLLPTAPVAPLPEQGPPINPQAAMFPSRPTAEPLNTPPRS